MLNETRPVPPRYTISDFFSSLLELARANRRSIQSVVRNFFERIAEELGRSPELARAFISSFLAGKGVRQLIDRNVSEVQRMAAQIVEIGQSATKLIQS